MRFLPIVAFFAVASCASPSAETVTAPDGQALTTVRCTSKTSKCFAKAQEVCHGQPYRVTNSYSNAGGFGADLLPGPVTWYTMTLQCGAPGGGMPSFPFRGATYADVLASMPAPAYSPPPRQQISRPIRCTSSRLGYNVNTTCY